MTRGPMQTCKDAFAKGEIEKADYIVRMHEHHRRLFEYAELIKSTDIEKIEIADSEVVMTIRSSGIRMLCDKDDRRIAPIEILNFDHYEQADFRMIMQLARGKRSVFDIGGNIGWYAINIAKHYPSSVVHTFEPIPKTYGYLQRNIALNGLGNVTSYNFGFSNKEQDLTFYYYPEGSGNASAANLSEQAGVQTITCHVTTLDTFVRQGGHTVDFIKCDVEGAELFVFQGGIDTLIQHRPVIFCELLRKWAARFNYHPNDVLRLLADLGYQCYVVQNGKLAPFGLVDEQTVETNYFFLHREKHADDIRKWS